MTIAARETLFLLDSDHAENALRELRRVARVTQVFPPRLAVVTGDVPTGVAGVISTYHRAAAELPPDLTDDELLFVAAWRERAGKETERRRGEGLAWDSPGFEPPDAPDGRG